MRNAMSLISSSILTMIGSAGCSRPLNWQKRKIPRPPRRNSSSALELLRRHFRFEVNLVAGKALAQFARLVELLHDGDECIGHWQNDFAFRPKQSNVLTDNRIDQRQCECSVV